MSRPLALLVLLGVAALAIALALRDPRPRAVRPVGAGPDAGARVEPIEAPVAVPDSAVAEVSDAAAIKPVAPPTRLRTDGWRALPIEASERVVALELRGAFKTPVGRMALRCIPEFQRTQLDAVKQETGFDPIEQVDRLYFADHIVAMEGRFDAVEQWAKMGGGFVETLTAPGVRVFVAEENREAFAVIDDRLLVVGENFEALKGALARLSGEAPAPLGPPTLGPPATLRGQAPAEDLLEPLPLPPGVKYPLAELLGEGMRARYSVQAGVGIDLDVALSGPDAERLAGAADALEAAVEAISGAADSEQGKAFARLFAGVKIERGEDGVHLTAALPSEALAAVLGECAQGE